MRTNTRLRGLFWEGSCLWSMEALATGFPLQHDNPSVKEKHKHNRKPTPHGFCESSTEGKNLTTRWLLIKQRWWETENPGKKCRIAEQNSRWRWRKNKMEQRHQPFLKARGESDRSPLHWKWAKGNKRTEKGGRREETKLKWEEKKAGLSSCVN